MNRETAVSPTEMARKALGLTTAFLRLLQAIIILVAALSV